MYKDNYYGANIIIFDSDTNMKIADAKIIRHDREIQSIYIDITNFELKNDEVYKILLIYEGRLHNYMGRTRGKISESVMEISLFDYSEVDLRGEPRFVVNKKAVAFRFRDIKGSVILEKKILMTILDISKNGMRVEIDALELEKNFTFDFMVTLDDKQIERLSAKVMRKSKDENSKISYGCELYRFNKEDE